MLWDFVPTNIAILVCNIPEHDKRAYNVHILYREDMQIFKALKIATMYNNIINATNREKHHQHLSVLVVSFDHEQDSKQINWS